MHNFRGETVGELAVALAIAAFLGLFVGLFLKCAIRIPPPDGVDRADWERITELEKLGTGKWIGRLETILFVGALWLGQLVIIGGWLTFKVAAKWDVWANVMKIPGELASDKITDFQIRHRFGGILLSRFLLGTLANILIAGLAAAVGANFSELIEWRFG